MSGNNSQGDTGSPDSLKSMLAEYEKELHLKREAELNSFINRIENGPSDSAVIDLNTMKVVQKGRMDFSYLKIDNEVSDKAKVLLEKILDKIRREDKKPGRNRKSTVPKKLAITTESKSPSIPPSSSLKSKIPTKELKKTDGALFNVATSPVDIDSCEKNLENNHEENPDKEYLENILEVNPDKKYLENTDNPIIEVRLKKNTIHHSTKNNEASTMRSPIKMHSRASLETKTPNLSTHSKRKSQPHKLKQNNTSSSSANFNYFSGSTLNTPNNEQKVLTVQKVLAGNKAFKSSISQSTRSHFSTLQDNVVPECKDSKSASGPDSPILTVSSKKINSTSKVNEDDVALFNEVPKIIVNQAKNICDSNPSLASNEAKCVFHLNDKKFESKRKKLGNASSQIISTAVKSTESSKHCLKLCDEDEIRLFNESPRPPLKRARKDFTNVGSFVTLPKISECDSRRKSPLKQVKHVSNSSEQFSKSTRKDFVSKGDSFVTLPKISKCDSRRKSPLKHVSNSLTGQFSKRVRNDLVSDGDSFVTLPKISKCGSHRKSPLKQMSVKHVSNSSEQFSKKARKDFVSNGDGFVTLPKISECGSHLKSPLKHVSNSLTEQFSKRARKDLVSNGNSFVTLPKKVGRGSHHKSPLKQVKHSTNTSLGLFSTRTRSNFVSSSDNFVTLPKMSEYSSNDTASKHVENSGNFTVVEPQQNAKYDFSDSDSETSCEISECSSKVAPFLETLINKNKRPSNSKLSYPTSFHRKLQVPESRSMCHQNNSKLCKRNSSVFSHISSSCSEDNTFQTSAITSPLRKRRYEADDEKPQKKRRILKPRASLKNSETAEDSFEWLLFN